jgi:hypothetical protein
MEDMKYSYIFCVFALLLNETFFLFLWFVTKLSLLI